ncbi:hypothetical protein ACUHGC_05410 [Testudinibacter sp. P27/CKL/0425]
MPKGELIHLFKEATKPKSDAKLVKKTIKAGSNSVIVIDSKSVNINVNKTERQSTKFTPSKEHIDASIAFRIRELIAKLAEKEQAAGATPQQAFAKWYSAIRKRYKVTTYQAIPANLGEEAITWLQQQSAIKRTKIRRNDNAQWRREHYTGIYARSANLGISKGELYNIVLQKYGKRISSLTQLGERDLRSLYQYIMGIR